MDIGINSENGTFKLRATGVIVKDGKMLLARSRRFDGFVFFGGHIMVGENSRDAVLREAKEELGFDVKINRLICINENLFPLNESDFVAHEVSFYYLLEPVENISTENFEVYEKEGEHEYIHKYEWIDLQNTREHNVRPHWIADMILEGKENYYYLSDQTKLN